MLTSSTAHRDPIHTVASSSGTTAPPDNKLVHSLQIVLSLRSGHSTTLSGFVDLLGTTRARADVTSPGRPVYLELYARGGGVLEQRR
jgi:hypothetical protein